MTYNFIETAINGHVFELTLNREAKRNAFTPTMVNEVAHALAEANADDRVRVVVLRANGPVFCAGMDLKTFQDRSLDQLNPEITNKEISLGEVMDSLNKPSIALVEGDVIAGGFLFILGCTYVLAQEQVRFKLPEIALGIFPFQVMAGLKRIMSEKRVLQLCLDAEFFNLQKAIDFGIADGILEDGQIKALIDSFADKSVYALQAGMEALKGMRELEGSEQYAYLLKSLNALRDRPEVKAFMEAKLKK